MALLEAVAAEPSDVPQTRTRVVSIVQRHSTNSPPGYGRRDYTRLRKYPQQRALDARTRYNLASVGRTTRTTADARRTGGKIR